MREQHAGEEHGTAESHDPRNAPKCSSARNTRSDDGSKRARVRVNRLQNVAAGRKLLRDRVVRERRDLANETHGMAPMRSTKSSPSSPNAAIALPNHTAPTANLKTPSRHATATTEPDACEAPPLDRLQREGDRRGDAEQRSSVQIHQN